MTSCGLWTNGMPWWKQQRWQFHSPLLPVTQLRITVKVYCSLHEMHLGMKENNFLPSKHASHSFFSKSWHNKITLVARRGGCWKLHSHFCTLLHAKMILFSDYWIPSALGTFLDILVFSSLICLTIAFKARQMIHILCA